MINEVVTSITRTLSNEFPEHDVLVDEIPQDFKKESFFVKVLAPSVTEQMDKRFMLIIPIDVHYWGNNNRERNAMFMQLNQLLEVLTSKTGNKFRGANRSMEIVDGCLHCFVTYRLFLTRIQVEEFMQTLEIKSNVKGE